MTFNLDAAKSVGCYVKQISMQNAQLPPREMPRHVRFSLGFGQKVLG